MRTILKYSDYISEENSISLNPESERTYGSLRSAKINEEITNNFDRVGYYLGYYKNLSPDGFTLERIDNSIVIRIPSDENTEQIAGLELPVILKNREK